MSNFWGAVHFGRLFCGKFRDQGSKFSHEIRIAKLLEILLGT